MSEKLKPCPFCGGEAALWRFYDLHVTNHYIGCTTCCAQTRGTDSDDLCIEV